MNNTHQKDVDLITKSSPLKVPQMDCKSVLVKQSKSMTKARVEFRWSICSPRHGV
jgi:hypothetical protein